MNIIYKFFKSNIFFLFIILILNFKTKANNDCEIFKKIVSYINKEYVSNFDNKIYCCTSRFVSCQYIDNENHITAM